MVTDVKANAKVAKTPKGPKVPAILSANDLLDGDVVFLDEAGGWTPDPAKAAVARDGEEAERLEAAGRAAAAANRIVDPYLVDVTLGSDGFPQANHFREAIRQTGPTVLPNLGKQAEF